jgi:cardiolipin synthase A/B
LPARDIGRRVLLTAAAASLARCAAVPDADDYVPPQGSTDPLQRHFALQQALGGGALVDGNRTALLNDGAQAFPAQFRAMAQARSHINLEYFILEDISSGGTTLSELLINRLRRGVAVNIIYDAYGSRDTPPALFSALRDAGARIVTFNPLDPTTLLKGRSLNDRDHRKITVVDGKIGFIGGINLARAYENPPSAGVPADGDTQHAWWRDTALEIHGPAVAELQKLFFDTWTKQNGPRVQSADYFPGIAREGVQTVRIIGSSPGDNQPLYYLSLESAIRAATARIWLGSGYFVPPHQEREDLAKAARRGVDLRIVAPSHSDVESAVYAARASYGDLLESGAHIFEMQDAVLHSKVATVDRVWTAVGSSNLDRRSVVFNNEADAIVLGAETANQVEAVLARDMRLSAPITLQAWRDRPLGERLDELDARLWQYWM